MTENERRQQLLKRLLDEHKAHPGSPWVSASVKTVPTELWGGIHPLVVQGLVEHRGALLRLTDTGMAEAEKSNQVKEST